MLEVGQTPNGSTTNSELIGLGWIAVSLSSVPFAFMVAGLVSRRPDWHIWTLAAMGLSLAVGLPLLIFRNPGAAILCGVAAGAVVSVDRPEGTTWHYRAIAAAIVSVVVLAGLSVDGLLLPMAAIGPALPFSAVGLADALAPRAAWVDDPA